MNPNDIYVRTSTEDRTYEVAGGMLFGIDPAIEGKSFKVFTEPASVSTCFPPYPDMCQPPNLTD